MTAAGSTPTFESAAWLGAGANEYLIKSSAIEVSYAFYGDPNGRPVLALHGAPASRFMFDVADHAARARGLCLICPDRPGYGRTPLQQVGVPTATLAERVQFLTLVLDALNITRCDVLGISGGGPYATALAAMVPDRVTALRLVSPMGPVAESHAQCPDGPAALSRSQQAFFLRLTTRPNALHAGAAAAAAMFKMAPRMFAGAFRRSLSPPDRRVLAQPAVARSLVAMTQEALRQGSVGGEADLAVFSEPWGIDFAAITASTVVWQGGVDRVVPAQATVYLAQLIPNADLRRPPDAGHFWVYDHVAEVLDTLVSAQ